MDIDVITTTLNLAIMTTVILLVICIPLASWLDQSSNPLTIIVNALTSLPLVLPPSVLGFYFLVFLNPTSLVGKWLENYLHMNLLFTFNGMLIASIILGIPFMIHPIRSGLANLPANLKEASYSLGKSKTKTLIYVQLPNIKPSILAGMILTFTHVLGEFGVILMIGGNIPGETKVISIAIYDEILAMNYPRANAYSLFLLLFSFLALIIIYFSNRKSAVQK